MALTSNGKECVICEVTGSVLYKEHAVKTATGWRRPELAPEAGERATEPADAATVADGDATETETDAVNEAYSATVVAHEQETSRANPTRTPRR